MLTWLLALLACRNAWLLAASPASSDATPALGFVLVVLLPAAVATIAVHLARRIRARESAWNGAEVLLVIGEVTLVAAAGASFFL
jgi:hypothetical protein